MPLLDLLNRRFGKNSFTDYSRDDNQNNDDTIEVSFKNSLPIDNNDNCECNVDEQKFIEELNGDLQLEWSAAINYYKHSSEIKGPENFLFVEELQSHGDDEIKHAKLLLDRINYLGGNITCGVGEIDVAHTDLQKIENDLSGETIAIKRYRERIQQAKELGDEGTAHILMQILTDEEHHENDLKTYLGV